MVKLETDFEVKVFETTEDHYQYQQLQRPNKGVRSNHLNKYLEFVCKIPLLTRALGLKAEVQRYAKRVLGGRFVRACPI